MKRNILTLLYYICDRIQAISSVFPGMSKTEQMSLCGFAKKMENELFANARTKVLTIYFCRLLDNLNYRMLSRFPLSTSMISIFHIVRILSSDLRWNIQASNKTENNPFSSKCTIATKAAELSTIFNLIHSESSSDQESVRTRSSDSCVPNQIFR